MALLAVLMPVAMLLVVLALGRYEDLMLPTAAEDAEPPKNRALSAPRPAPGPDTQV